MKKNFMTIGPRLRKEEERRGAQKGQAIDFM